MAILEHETKDQSTTDENTLTAPEPADDVGGDGADEGEGQSSAPEGQTSAAERGADGKFLKPQGGNRRGRREAFQKTTEQMENRVTERVRQEMQAFESRFQQMLGAQRPQQQAPQQQGPQTDPTLDALETALQSEIAALTAHDHSKGKPDFSRYNTLQARIQHARSEAATLAVLQRIGLTPDALQRMRQPPRESFGKEAQYSARFYTMANEFPWLNQAEHAKSVGAYRRYLIDGLGRPDTIDTDREAAAHIAAQKRLGARQVPRGNEQRFAGMRSNEGGGERPSREVRLPQGVLQHLSPDELKRAQGAIFDAE